MDKAEARKKVRELVDYMLDTNDEDVINHYDDMMWDLMQQYANEVSREKMEIAFKAGYAAGIDVRASKYSFIISFDKWYDEWKSNKKDK